MSPDPFLQAQGVCAYYGTSQALFDLDLSVARGQVMALIGRNGAGKSTTMRTLMGLLPCEKGAISFAGKALAGMQPYQIARAGLGYVPEDRQVFPTHTVLENLEIAERPGVSGMRDWTIQRAFELFPILYERRNGSASLLSGGEQQMLSIARTLVGNPELLLLDEPSEGLAPIIVNQIAEVILTFRRAGLTVLLAEQNMHFCLRVATDVTVISKGSAVFSGTVDAFRHDDEIKRRHLVA